MIFHRSDNKSLQFSRTRLSILADLNNAVAWTVSTCPFISKSSCLFTNPLRIVPSAPIRIGITVTFMFHSCWFFFLFSGKVQVLFFFFHFLLFLICDPPARQIPQYDRIRWSIFFSIFQRILCDLWMDSGLCIYYLFKFKFLAKFLVNNLPDFVVSRFICFCANFSHYYYHHHYYY